MAAQSITSVNPKFTPYPDLWTNSYRAWVLVKVKEGNPIDIARTIYELNDTVPFNKDTEGFIVRADVVQGSELFEIVVPVNASDPSELDKIINEIYNVGGVDGGLSIRADVVAHNPVKPHRTVGYIPFNERNQSMGIDGYNSWG